MHFSTLTISVLSLAKLVERKLVGFFIDYYSVNMFLLKKRKTHTLVSRLSTNADLYT
jgi:hypothetical protein